MLLAPAISGETGNGTLYSSFSLNVPGRHVGNMTVAFLVKLLTRGSSFGSYINKQDDTHISRSTVPE